jgi:hypothetical protein
MKSRFSICFSILIIVLSSCEKCDECFTPPEPFIFVLVNEDGENLFSVGTYNEEQLTIIETSSNQNFDFQFIAENNSNLIEINSLGWTSEKVSLSFRIEEKEIFTFNVDAERKSEDCCSFTKYNQISIEGAEFDVESKSGVYEVVIK